MGWSNERKGERQKKEENGRAREPGTGEGAVIYIC